MKVGVIIPNFSAPADPATIVAVAQAAEELGFDSVWMTHPHHDAARPRRAVRTYLRGAHHARLHRRRHQRVELGTSVIVLPPTTRS